MQVELGNPAAVQRRTVDNPDGTVDIDTTTLDGPRVTYVDFADEKTLGEAFVAITDPRGVWGAHTDGGVTPTYVWSDNASLQALLAEHFGCPAGRPADLEQTYYTVNGPAGVDSSQGPLDPNTPVPDSPEGLDGGTTPTA